MKHDKKGGNGFYPICRPPDRAWAGLISFPLAHSEGIIFVEGGETKIDENDEQTADVKPVISILILDETRAK